MDTKFLTLPPHKRFNLTHPQNPTVNPPDYSSFLPAKKRKQSPVVAAVTTIALPAKKRILALHPSFVPDKPFSSFDLNLEYDPKTDDGNVNTNISVCDLKTDDGNVSSNISVHDLKTDDRNVNSNISVVVKETQKKMKDEESEEEDEDGILCAVCQSTDGDPSDPIVFCDGCDLTVHTTCYGRPLINEIPEGDWFCSQCETNNHNHNRNKETLSCYSCCLCSINGGAMKPTNDGRWAHIVCALLIPEVFFWDPEGREGIDCSKVPVRRWGKKCYVCKESSGCVLDCSEEKCGLRFHVTCGVKEDLCIEYKEGRNRGAIVAGFCKSHTDLWMKQQATGKYKIVARNEK